jgi:hypothetical protein
MRARIGLLLILVLPGLCLAGVGGLRVCLSSMLGGVDCCAPQPGEPSCCSSGQEEPAPPQAPGDDCSWCCVDLDGNAPFDEGATRTHAQPLLAALEKLPVASLVLGVVGRPLAWAGAPRPPPGASANLPLRI